jgi:hypothetical protein
MARGLSSRIALAFISLQSFGGPISAKIVWDGKEAEAWLLMLILSFSPGFQIARSKGNKPKAKTGNPDARRGSGQFTPVAASPTVVLCLRAKKLLLFGARPPRELPPYEGRRHSLPSPEIHLTAVAGAKRQHNTLQHPRATRSCGVLIVF